MAVTTFSWRGRPTGVCTMNSLLFELVFHPNKRQASTPALSEDGRLCNQFISLSILQAMMSVSFQNENRFLIVMTNQYVKTIILPLQIKGPDTCDLLDPCMQSSSFAVIQEPSWLLTLKLLLTIKLFWNQHALAVAASQVRPSCSRSFFLLAWVMPLHCKCEYLPEILQSARLSHSLQGNPENNARSLGLSLQKPRPNPTQYSTFGDSLICHRSISLNAAILREDRTRHSSRKPKEHDAQHNWQGSF